MLMQTNCLLRIAYQCLHPGVSQCYVMGIKLFQEGRNSINILPILLAAAPLSLRCVLTDHGTNEACVMGKAFEVPSLQQEVYLLYIIKGIVDA